MSSFALLASFTNVEPASKNVKISLKRERDLTKAHTHTHLSSHDSSYFCCRGSLKLNKEKTLQKKQVFGLFVCLFVIWRWWQIIYNLIWTRTELTGRSLQSVLPEIVDRRKKGKKLYSQECKLKEECARQFFALLSLNKSCLSVALSPKDISLPPKTGLR